MMDTLPVRSAPTLPCPVTLTFVNEGLADVASVLEEPALLVD